MIIGVKTKIITPQTYILTERKLGSEGYQKRDGYLFRGNNTDIIFTTGEFFAIGNGYFYVPNERDWPGFVKEQKLELDDLVEHGYNPLPLNPSNFGVEASRALRIILDNVSALSATDVFGRPVSLRFFKS